MQETAYSYERLHLYDSAEYYFQLSEKLQPQRLNPKLYLLNLFLVQSDTTSAIEKAKEIIDFKNKIDSKEADKIKSYAKEVLNNLTR